MDRRFNQTALQQVFQAGGIEHLVDPIGLRFVEEGETGEPIRSLALSREGGKDGVAPWFRLEFNSPTNGCEAPHIALLELSDLHLRIRLQGDALIRSGTIAEPGRELVAELVVKFELAPAPLRKCHDKLKKIADGLLKVRYVGHALRAGDDKDNRRS